MFIKRFGVMGCAVALFAAMGLCGCGSGPVLGGLSATHPAQPFALKGNVHGGQQAVVGSQVYLYAISNANGGTATSVLNTPGFVITDGSGSFSISGDYTCPNGAYVYLLALGGNPGLSYGFNNEIALASGLGPCASLSNGSYVTINEVTTLAFAYAVSAYATSDTQIGTSTSLAGAFAYVNAVENEASGQAFGNHDGYILPQMALNSLANSIASCINSSGVGAPCSTLITAANASPANTFQAVLNIVKNPAANVGTVYNLGTPNAVFQPTLTSPPSSWSLVATAPDGSIIGDPNIYLFYTSLGNIRVQLRPDVAPQTVANFRYYVNNGSYTNMFFHRSVAGFVIQGGGYTFSNGQVYQIPTQPPAVNEFHLSNVRGTIAMALIPGQANSATDQFFFNTANNAASLDPQGYTVFGSILDSSGLAVMDAINALPTTNAGTPFDQLPVIGYTNGNVTASNLVFSPITVTPQ